MLVWGPSARAFDLRGVISMEAAQTNCNVYHAPASRAHADMARSIRIHTTHLLAKKRGALMPPSKVRECTRRTKVSKQGLNM